VAFVSLVLDVGFALKILIPVGTAIIIVTLETWVQVPVFALKNSLNIFLLNIVLLIVIYV